MLSRHCELNCCQRIAAVVYLKGRHSVFIEKNIRRPVIAVFVETKGHHIAVTLYYLVYERIGVVGYYYARLRHQGRKFVEGADDMVYILEIIKMIRVDIQYNFYLRSEAEKAVHVLTGLGNEILAVADLHIAAYFSQIAPNQNSRLKLCSFQNQRNHRGGCSFAVGSGYSYTVFVFVHQYAQHLSSGHSLDSPLCCPYNLRIVFPNCRRIYD